MSSVTSDAPQTESQGNTGMRNRLFQAAELARFYFTAKTKYQIHSPFAFEWVQEVVEDGRWYYAFEAIEWARDQMLKSELLLEVLDYGAGRNGVANDEAPRLVSTSVATVARRSGSGPQQGQRLFKLANWLDARQVLEFGASLGIGTMYLSAALEGTNGQMVALEGCPDCANIARKNLEILEYHKTEIITGAFEQTLDGALKKLGRLDLIWLDGNHRYQPTLDYFEACLPFSHHNTVFVFDDVHWSPGMARAWKAVQSHPKVTLTLDCWDFACAFINPDFKEKQHFNIVPSRWKPWKKF